MRCLAHPHHMRTCSWSPGQSLFQFHYTVMEFLNNPCKADLPINAPVPSTGSLSPHSCSLYAGLASYMMDFFFFSWGHSYTVSLASKGHTNQRQWIYHCKNCISLTSSNATRALAENTFAFVFMNRISICFDYLQLHNVNSVMPLSMQHGGCYSVSRDGNQHLHPVFSATGYGTF